MSYCPTHVHTCYSVRDGIIKIEEYAKKCAELKLPAACVTDHGNLHAAFKVCKEFKKYGIKPIIGQECYYATDITEKGDNYHLILLAKNDVGFKNLAMLSSIAFVDGFYRKPRVDKTLLAKYSEGLICTTACIFGKAQQHIINKDMDAGLEEIENLRSIFGEDLYLEIADHQLEDEIIIRDAFRNIGNDLGIKVLPATDSHYLNHEDKAIHTIFKQIAFNSIGKEDDDGFPGTGYHIWTPEEMRVSFSDEEIANTLEVADKCKVGFEFTGYFLPQFPVPQEGVDSYTYLYELALKGLELKHLKGNKDYEERLAYEMHQLHLTELEDYFLIVADYIKWCNASKIPTGPGRGSGAGSLVSYLVGITTVDPLQYDLLFARCINPGRALQYDFGL